MKMKYSDFLMSLVQSYYRTYLTVGNDEQTAMYKAIQVAARKGDY